jgi:hypothetical protein
MLGPGPELVRQTMWFAEDHFVELQGAVGEAIERRTHQRGDPQALEQTHRLAKDHLSVVLVALTEGPSPEERHERRY